MSRSDGRTLIHLVDRDGDTVMPLCRDWSHATNWTTLPAVASCEECLARLARDRTRRATEPMRRGG